MKPDEALNIREIWVSMNKALTTENCQKYLVFVQPPKSDTFFGKSDVPTKEFRKKTLKAFQTCITLIGL